MTRLILIAAAGAALTLAGCQSPPRGEPPAESAVTGCGAAFVEQGYKDGLEGRPSRAAESGCSEAVRRDYTTRYGAGAYVRNFDGASVIGADAATAQPIPGANRTVLPRANPSDRGARDPGILVGGSDDAARNRQVRALTLERNRLEQQLLKPTTSAGDRTLINRRLRTIDRQRRALQF